jgi:hypothetical protein
VTATADRAIEIANVDRVIVIEGGADPAQDPTSRAAPPRQRPGDLAADTAGRPMPSADRDPAASGASIDRIAGPDLSEAIDPLGVPVAIVVGDPSVGRALPRT